MTGSFGICVECSGEMRWDAGSDGSDAIPGVVGSPGNSNMYPTEPRCTPPVKLVLYAVRTARLSGHIIRPAPTCRAGTGARGSTAAPRELGRALTPSRGRSSRQPRPQQWDDVLTRVSAELARVAGGQRELIWPPAART